MNKAFQAVPMTPPSTTSCEKRAMIAPPNVKLIKKMMKPMTYVTGMIKMLLTIPNFVYKRLARKSETKKVTAVVMLVNSPLNPASPAASPEY